MAKEIVRTIPVYKHTFGKLSRKGEGFDIDGYHEVILFEKLGTKRANKYIKDNGLGDVHLLGIEQMLTKYAMPLETFIEYAVVVDEKIIDGGN